VGVGDEKETNFDDKKNNNMEWKLIKKNIWLDIKELYLNFKNNISLPIFKKSYVKYGKYKKILSTMEDYVYKIKVENIKTFGFFCKIPLSNKNTTLYTLITNNTFINEELKQKKDAKIFIEFHKEKKIIEIMMKNRKNYTSKKYNMAIIEIKKEDGINNYLELDEDLIKIINGAKDEEITNKYIDKLIYMINNQMGIFSVTFTKITNKENNYNFWFELNKNLLTNGAPIFRLSKNKLIGIINFSNYNNILNSGTFLNFPIKEYINKNFNK